jgi:Zn-dependent protease
MATAETLQAEARERPRIAIAAAAAAFFTLAAPVVGLIVLKGAPSNLVGEALQRQQHLAGLAVSAVCSALGLLAITVTLDFLLRAVRARRSDLPWQIRPLLWAGGIGLAILLLALQVATSVKLDHFAHEGSQTYEEARKVSDFGSIAYLGILAQLAFAGAFVVIAVTAMRVGLLTRFLGYLGVISAVLFVLPLVPIPVVQAYWLGALAMLFAGRSPSGTPPAWQSGEAMPWPSPADMREQRVRDAEARRGGDVVEGTAAEPDDELPGLAPAKRKRKKRR